MHPGPEIMRALDGFSPRHKPIFIDVIRNVPLGDWFGAAHALGEKCAEMNLQEMPNPFPVGDGRRDEWKAGWNDGRYGAGEGRVSGISEAGISEDEFREMTARPIPDFHAMTKPEINDWLAANIEEAINQRLTKPDMIAEATRLAIGHGYRHPA